MTYLFFTLILTVALFLIFRAFPLFKIKTFPAIVFNYCTCFAVSCMVTQVQLIRAIEPAKPWFLLSFITGVLFIFTFNLIAYTVQKVNVSVATIANKMSLVIPVSYSIFFTSQSSKTFNILNYLGIIIGLVSIILASYKPAERNNNTLTANKLILPFTVFIFGGLIDLLLNYINQNHLTSETSTLLAFVAFFAAAFTGLSILTYNYLAKGETVSAKEMIAGLILGIPNYFSIYFLLKTLSAYNNNGAIVFPSLNIGVIVFASLLAFIIFKDKLTKINITGIFFAVIAIILLFAEQ